VSGFERNVESHGAPSVRVGGKSVLTMSIVSSPIGTPDRNESRIQRSARPIESTSREA
jgi:hypothetical protein